VLLSCLILRNWWNLAWSQYNVSERDISAYLWHGTAMTWDLKTCFVSVPLLADHTFINTNVVIYSSKNAENDVNPVYCNGILLYVEICFKRSIILFQL